MKMEVADSHIFIDRLRLHAFHGVMEQERHVGADFEVSLRVDYNISEAMETDDVATTVSYADLCSIVEEEMRQPSCLLEHVAGRIAKAVMLRFTLVTGIRIKIVKLNPPMGADCNGAGVELRIKR